MAQTHEGQPLSAAALNGGGAAVRLAIIARCATVRTALRQLCTRTCNAEIVCELGGIERAACELDQARAAVVLLCPATTITECLRLQGELAHLPEPPGIIIIQAQLQPEPSRALVQRGVLGILDEEATDQDLAVALAVVAVGQPYLSRGVRTQLNIVSSAHAPLQTMISLTPREHQVLMLLIGGESNHDIARQLDIAVKTVEMHVSRIYSRLGVRSRTQAARRAREWGLLGIATLPPQPGHRAYR